MNCIPRIAAIALCCIAFGSAKILAESARPFPQHALYSHDSIYPSNYSQDEQDQHVRDFYDIWKQRYLVDAGTSPNGTPMYRVITAENSPLTFSEGQGYGMVIVALMAGHDPDSQQLFDGLWAFSRQHLSAIDNLLMSWKIDNGSSVDGNDSAFDGDADIAYSLLLAEEQWGETSPVNYKAEASQVMEAILLSTVGADSLLPKLGDWVSDNGGQYNQYSPRSSDFMPAHFHAFARATQDPTWNQVVLNSQAVIDSIQKNHSPNTGLLPDFIVDCDDIESCRPAGSGFLEGPYDGQYYYNAGRVPWRISLDALLNDDPVSKAQALKMSRWLHASTGGQIDNIKSGYTLDGEGIHHDFISSFFVAPFAVAAMLDPEQQDFLNDLYDYIYQQHENYYSDSINLFSLLILSGNYWNPVADGPLPDDNPGEKEEDAFSVEIDVFSDWGSGYCATVAVENLSNRRADWKVDLSIDGQISTIWNATYTQAGADVVAEGIDWNNFISAGEIRHFGFCAQQ